MLNHSSRWLTITLPRHRHCRFPQAQLAELGEAGLAARVDAACAKRDDAVAALAAADKGVEAATRELAGARPRRAAALL